MIQFDLKKYLPKFTLNSNGKKSIICEVRKKHIYPSPEELIRQAFIKYLISEKGFPIQSFEIEKPLVHFVVNGKGRADLVIFDDTRNIPLIIVEFKEGNMQLTDDVLLQIETYDEIIRAENQVVVIGDTVYFFSPIDDSNGDQTLVLRDEIPTYFELISGADFSTSEFDFYQYIRPPIKGPFSNELIQEYFDAIGEDTDVIFYPFIFNLIGWIEDSEDELISNEIVDLGIRNTKFGNAGGGGYFGSYRSFEFSFKNSAIIISFGIKGTSKMVNDKAFGNRRGLSYLMVAVDSHFSLQLCIDKYVQLGKEVAEIWHDGTITIGKLGQAKRQDLIDFIIEKDPDLVVNGKILLGRLDLTKEIKSDQNQLVEFLMKCIHYVLLRDEFREFKKSKST